MLSRAARSARDSELSCPLRYTHPGITTWKFSPRRPRQWPAATTTRMDVRANPTISRARPELCRPRLPSDSSLGCTLSIKGCDRSTVPAEFAHGAGQEMPAHFLIYRQTWQRTEMVFHPCQRPAWPLQLLHSRRFDSATGIALTSRRPTGRTVVNTVR